MSYVLFSEPKAAFKHRSTWGGWLAVDQNGGHHWWPASMTISKVMTSPQLRGLSAKFM